jgi:hypothetical protein
LVGGDVGVGAGGAGFVGGDEGFGEVEPAVVGPGGGCIIYIRNRVYSQMYIFIFCVEKDLSRGCYKIVVDWRLTYMSLVHLELPSSV